MTNYFSYNYTGAPFRLFGFTHLATLVFIAGGILLVYGANRRYGSRFSEPFRFLLAGTIAANEVIWHYWNAINGLWTVQGMLPFHLCGTMVWVSVFLLLKPSFRVFELLYYLGIGGALQALVTPNLEVFGFPHYRFFETYIAHTGIIYAALFCIFARGYRPTLKGGVRALIIGNIYLVIVYGINLILGSNYMYVMHKPETFSVLNYFGPWPYYILGIELFAAVNMLLLYLPWGLINRLKHRRTLIREPLTVIGE
ncbi:MAG: TIGR02206 family membrane protein [FCB group bacterium]|nr:TIGR02206 family membrane protein [FCB group bacterium]